MTRNCSCGGRNVPSGYASPHVKKFVCDKCGTIRTQRLRQPKKLG